MSKPTQARLRAAVSISLRQKHGPMASYWTAQVRRGGKKATPLFENSDASRAIALSGAELWCNRLGYKYKIIED